MAKAKVAVTLDEKILIEVDRLVTRRVFPNRSRALEEAMQEKLDRMSHDRLAHECAKLDPSLEKAMAEEGMAEELERWPEY
ncbi:MAG: CopG family transcriptional regulator [Geobacteraceae bacterium GWC2_58_44]|nr:MAG: CopG family transcriptional regulator [Geobacteraceae bacterium GWC2_58_44]HBG04581.1 CopG family transcriptional regulator [Geobacter sp.]